ncbi:hypothetical protein LIER_15693 [Lithospermum erythrorhizon]|uniref:RNase H type-1 domain-containing protein n=1 Tax=Lithospermum erythrorhizon TaxID=34254 RepID=A0AAV3Q8H2_LITER
MEVLPSYIVAHILNIHIPTDGHDKAIWKLSMHGDFTIKSMWNKILSHSHVDPCLAYVWHNAIPTSVSAHMWRLLKYGGWDHAFSELGIKIPKFKRSPPLALIWQKHAECVIKLNVDGSYVHQGLARSRGIFRDYRGQICSDLGWKKVIIKTDSMEVIDNVIKRRGAWRLNHLVDKITHLLERNRNIIQYVIRDVNSVAD